MADKVSGVPNQTQKNFIRKKLIPFILREQGRGFCMEMWGEKFPVGISEPLDGVEREIPTCGTVCCIGGSIQHLVNRNGRFTYWSQRVIARLSRYIGLTTNEARGLFLNWGEQKGDASPCIWPVEFQEEFQEASTPKDKAKVAVALLRKIAREGGKCLHPKKVAQS